MTTEGDMKFTLRQLQVFDTLAGTGHFGQAAEQLKCSQPTVSSDVRSLEEVLGLRLFNRSRRGAELTEAGQALLPIAKRVLRESDMLRAEARQLRNGAVQVRLAATPSLINRLVPSLLHALNEAGSPLQVDVVEVETGGVQAALAEERADVGVGHHLVVSETMERREVARDELCVLTAGSGLDPTTSIDLSTLAGRKLLIWPREKSPVYYDTIMRACRERGLEPEVEHSTSRFTGSESYRLTEGEAFCLVPFDFAREAPRSLAYAPIDPPETVPLHVAWSHPPATGAMEVVNTLTRLRRGPRRRTGVASAGRTVSQAARWPGDQQRPAVTSPEASPPPPDRSHHPA